MSNTPPKKIRKKTLPESKKTTKMRKKTYYDSPLKHIQSSTKRWEQILRTKKLIRAQERAAKQHNIRKRKKKFLHESVIVLSDDERDLNNQNNVDCCNNSTGEMLNESCTSAKDASIIVLDNLRRISVDNNKIQEWADVLEKKRKRKASGIESNNNASCLILSPNKDLETTIQIDEENIAPCRDATNKGSDDIEVVWSSTKTSPVIDKHKDQSRKQTNTSGETNNKLFMIDCSPNLRNLKVLKSDYNPPKKRRKVMSNEEMEELENDLPLNRAGLEFPKARNISARIMMETSRFPRRYRNREEYPSTSTFMPTVSTAPTTVSATILGMDDCQDVPTNEPSNASLREIVIDGNNVALGHSKNKHHFSEPFLKLVIDYFQKRGHTVTVFVPQNRRSQKHQLLEQLHTEGIVVFTPSRTIGSRTITPYDDRYILQYATMRGAIVISSDQFRDLYQEKPEWRDTIENRLMAPTFVGNYVMFPEDPLGRNGPTLDEFLRY